MVVLFPRTTFYQYRLTMNGQTEFKSYAKKITNVKAVQNYFENLGYEKVTIQYCGCYRV